MADGKPLHEVRALLRAFGQSDLKSLHVVKPDMEVFFTRDATIRPDARPQSPEPAAPGVELLAPHLGTLVQLAAAGTLVAAGDVYGKLAVLDELRDLAAAHAGVIAGHCRALGDLVEFGQPVALLAP